MATIALFSANHVIPAGHLQPPDGAGHQGAQPPPGSSRTPRRRKRPRGDRLCWQRRPSAVRWHSHIACRRAGRCMAAVHGDGLPSAAESPPPPTQGPRNIPYNPPAPRCRQQQASRSTSTRAAAGGAVVVMAAAGGSKGKALISVSDKTGLDALAKVGGLLEGFGLCIRHCGTHPSSAATTKTGARRAELCGAVCHAHWDALKVKT